MDDATLKAINDAVAAATAPLTQEIADLKAALAALPPPAALQTEISNLSNSFAALKTEISNGAANALSSHKIAWIDAVLSKWFASDMPPIPADDPAN